MKRQPTISVMIAVMALFVLPATMLILPGCVLFLAADSGYPLDIVIRQYAQGDLGLDIQGGEITDWYDNHGGFHGDGETYLEVHFADDTFAQRLAGRDDWHALPLDPDVEQFIYRYGGTYWNSTWVEEHGEWIPKPAKVPAVEHGFWCLVDRQPESYRSERVREDEPFGINNRYSYNLTIGLYDADHRILYVMALDT